MGLGNSFLINLGMLITVAYLANVLYKYWFTRTSRTMNYILSVLLMIFSGWICMMFGFKLSDNVIFDLRFVPLLIATAVYSQPLTIMIIGFGIGLARFTFGITEAALAGFLNLAILGIVCAGINIWMRRSQYRFVIKGLIAILIVNAVNTINIAVLGVIPFKQYMLEIMPSVLPLSIGLSIVFALILRDFQLDRRRSLELKYANERLRTQTKELQKAKHILEERAEQLALASHHKSEFLANMSHELRTPLNSIINLAQMISENDPEEASASADYGRIIYRSGQELLQIINDILDLSKVEAGRLEVVQEAVNVLELPQMLYLQFEQTARQKGLAFEINLAGDLPATISSDPQRIGQILRNLLSNAFKFTDEGYVKLEVYRSKTEGEQAGESIVFTVKDTGIGIPQDKHAVIFEAFQQADGSISRKYGGTGLGLPISRHLACLLGGRIEVQSAEGRGSTFMLYLPLTSQEPLLQSSAASAQNQAIFAGRDISG
ncbi:sensor histidine kinase [Paenibacillus lentus]|uniref:Circadian input-output histidine kinase CikA n=1 Tax=Paenibacillus lentus TaxID=1338368 RepID=A0A3S8S0R7_9BACL|nr:ATP-binding protein [Paenibacillus lentus]AZK48813.1 sensor histidine kinase [Paenibacillus lentus]